MIYKVSVRFDKCWFGGDKPTWRRSSKNITKGKVIQSTIRPLSRKDRKKELYYEVS